MTGGAAVWSMRRPHLTAVRSLCITQVITWGTLYYAFGVLHASLARAHGWDAAGVMGAFSFSLLVTGFCTFPAGLAIQKWGGRWTMAAGSMVAAVSLAAMAEASSLAAFHAAWGLAGAAMALCSYDAAFATLASISGLDYRRAVTTVTLAGGFASTVFWPLTEWLASSAGWRATLFIHAALQLGVCLPLHLLGGLDAGRRGVPRATPEWRGAAAPLPRDARFPLLAASFTLNSLVLSSLSVHLIPILQSSGTAPAQAAWLAACAGPMQVAGRIGELALAGRYGAAPAGWFALAILIPALAALRHASGLVWMMAAVAAYGLSNGLMTIVRSVSVAELFGREQYPRISSAIGTMPAFARAAGPVTASLVAARTGSYGTVLAILTVSSIASLLLFGAAVRRTAGPAGK